MGLGDIDDQESDFASILLVEFIQGGNLPPEGRSGVTAKDQDHRLSLGSEFRKLHHGALVELQQGEIGGGIAYMQLARTSAQPQGLERKKKKWDRSRQFGHEAGKCFRRLSHDVVEESASEQPQKNDCNE